MSSPCLLLAGLLAVAPVVRAAPAQAPADAPIPRTDRNSRVAHAQLLEKAARGGIDLYFLGDSITRRWGCTDRQYADLFANWRTNFFGWNAGNFGWGADTVQNMLWRLQQGELDEVNPKVVVILAGTNDVGSRPPPPDGLEPKADRIVQAIRALLGTVRNKAPGAAVILMGITPRNDRGSTAVMPLIGRINERLAGLADGKAVRFINVNDRLADSDGRLLEGMTVDGLHLSAKGYQVWADALKPVLTELMGPPAKTDHAPPPTGDPGVRN